MGESDLTRNELVERVRQLERELAAASSQLDRFQREREVAERDLNRLFDLSLDFICTATLEGYFKQVNPVFTRRLGYSEDELLGKPFIEFIHADDRASTMKAMQRLSEGGDVVQFENRYCCKDGSYRWLAWSCPAPKPGEDILYAIARDVTEERTARVALIASEARYRDLFENANDMIMTVDLHGNITALNKVGEELTGYSADELLGNTSSILFNADQAAKMREINHRMATTGERAHYESDISARDGGKIPVEINSRLIYQDGQPYAVQSIARDITERREHEKQLTIAKEEAEAASQSKSDFLANMSHEIRTPMNAVIGMTELLLDSELDRVQREYLQTVLSSADSLMGIINEVLDFSKIESGKIDLTPIVFDVRECIGDTLKALAMRAHEKRLELAWQVSHDVPRMLIGDPARLRQVIVNLVGNAIKFTASGEVVLGVAGQLLPDHEAKLHFTVADTGIGIPAEKLESVFYAFEQVDSSTTRRFGGTGLGLAISKRVVELMGGEIWVDSKQEKGSIFHFTAEFRVANDLSKPDAGEFTDAQSIFVLIVDDNQTNRTILEEMLGNWGIRCRCVGSAALGLDLLKQQSQTSDPFTLLITDLQMPEMDGITFVRLVRQDHRFDTLRVIVLGSSRNQQANLNNDADLRLLKPVKQSEMRDALIRITQATKHGRTQDELVSDAMPSRPLRVLMAEDGIANQKLAVGLLTRWGHEVVVAQDGQEAIELFQAQPFDVILMDVQMPKVDGLEATRKIRSLETAENAHVPIIAMTAHAMTADRERCFQAGMDGFVAKPIRKLTLLQALQEHTNSQPESDNDALSARPPMSTPAKAAAQVSPPRQLDWEEALAQLDGDRELLAAVAETAMVELPTRMNSLRVALEAEDKESATREAHTIKGALRIFGSTPVGNIAAQIETANDLTPEIQALFQELSHAMDLLLPELSSHQQWLEYYASRNSHE